MNRITDEERPRFLADEGFNMDVTTGLRLRYSGIDLLTVQEAGLLHALDPQLLEAARQLDRILLSHDVHTLPGYYYALLSQLSQDEHLPGILLVVQEAPIGQAIEWIAEIWGASRHDEWRDRVDRLPL
ncbi:MAG: DUF5615 family PIN-like protein [Ktedonobacterales bacterium]